MPGGDGGGGAGSRPTTFEGGVLRPRYGSAGTFPLARFGVLTAVGAAFALPTQFRRRITVTEFGGKVSAPPTLRQRLIVTAIGWGA